MNIQMIADFIEDMQACEDVHKLVELKGWPITRSLAASINFIANVIVLAVKKNMTIEPRVGRSAEARFKSNGDAIAFVLDEIKFAVQTLDGANVPEEKSSERGIPLVKGHEDLVKMEERDERTL